MTDLPQESPLAIQVRGARVHNLAGIDVDIPLRQLVAVAGVSGINLAEATAKTLDDLVAWASTVEPTLPAQMRPMARLIVAQLTEMARRLVELGLGYLGLDRAGSTLSTGERQRVQLARAVRNQTTGVLSCTRWTSASCSG